MFLERTKAINISFLQNEETRCVCKGLARASWKAVREPDNETNYLS